MRGGLCVILVAAASAAGGCGPGSKSAGPAPPPPVPLAEQYRQAVARLSGGGPDRDEGLCKAFVAVLDDLAARDDPTVFFTITDTADPADPPLAALDLAAWKEDSEFRPLGEVKNRVFPQDVVFGGDAAERRRKDLTSFLRGAVKTVADEPLLKLVPLAAGAAREGKSVLDLRATTHRGEAHKKVRLVNAPFLMRDFRIDWELKVSGRDGKVLAAVSAATSPRSLDTEIKGGTWEYESPQGQLRVLGGVASEAQLISAYRGFFWGVVDKKLGGTAAAAIDLPWPPPGDPTP